LLQSPTHIPAPPVSGAEAPKATSAARVRRHRARRRAAKRPITVEVDEWIVSLLIEAKFLAEWDRSDEAKIAEALNGYLFYQSRYEPT
jgi:hypothetical protein